MDPKIILVKSSRGAGLGDCLRVVVAGIAYARASGRRVVVDWRDGSFGPEGENMFPTFFRLDPQIACAPLSAEIENSASVHPPIWAGRLAEPVHRLYDEQGWTSWDRGLTRALLSADLQEPSYEQEVVVLTDFTGLSPHLAPQALPRPLHDTLRPSQAIEAELSRFQEENLRTPTIGIHLRDTSEPGAAQKARQEASVLCALRSLLRRWPRVTVFLATDNRATQERYLDLLPGLVVREKALPPPGSPVHLCDYGPSREEKTRDAVIDMLLLSRCDALIHPCNSSFSIVASQLSATHARLRLALPPDRRPWPSRLRRRMLTVLRLGR